MAGNYLIEDEALKKRLFVIDSPGFTFDYKNRIIWESTIPTLLKSYGQNGKYFLKVEDLTEQDRSRITEFVQLDQDPGFRTIESVLMHYFSYIARRKYFEPDAQEPGHISQLILDSNQELAEKKARRN